MSRSDRVRSRRAATLAAGLALALAGLACTCPPRKEGGTTPAGGEEPGPAIGAGNAAPGSGTTAPPAPPAANRVAAVPADHPLRDRLEGLRFQNACASDAACFVTGCSGEICSADEGIMSTCEEVDWARAGARCGCLAGECVWYRVEEAAPPPGPDGGGPAAGPAPGSVTGGAQGKPCIDGACQPGLACLAYFGIAGPRGPRFSSCEIPCALGGSVCPPGQRCVTIADGPGRVCRPGADPSD